MIVVDTMIPVYAILETPWTQKCRALRKIDSSWAVPTYAEVEVANVLWKHVKRGDFSLDAAKEIYRVALWWIADRFEIDDQNALTMAVEYNISVYDARFASLAAQMKVPLISYDRRLVERVPWASTPDAFLDQHTG